MKKATDSVATGVSRRSVIRSGLAGGMVAIGSGAISGSAVAAPQGGARASGKFQLQDDAEIVAEPGVRPVNHVVRIDTSEDGRFGSVGRYLNVQADELDDQLSFEYNILDGDCGGGSPRIILSIDDTGDGEHDFYLVTDGPGSPGWESCPAAQGEWERFDSTDDGDTYWRVHPGTGFQTWTDAKALLSVNHTVRSGALVDDSFWQSGAAGTAMYDEISIGDRVLRDRRDTVGN